MATPFPAPVDPRKPQPGQPPVGPAIGQPPGQYGGINPSANTVQSPDFNPGGQAGQSGQYGGINPGGGLDTSPGGPVLGSAAGQGGVMDTTQPVPYGGGASTQPAPPTDPGGPDTSPGGPTPIPNTVEGFQSWVQSTFGRQATPQELQQVSSRIGPPGGPNGTYTPQQMQAAQAEAQRMAQAMGGGQTPAPGQPAPTPAPSTAPDQAGIGQFQNWAQTTFGRQATPQELQQIAVQIGYTGGTITPQQMQQAQQVATQMAQRMGWQPPASPAPTTPAPSQTPTTPYTPGPGVTPPTPAAPAAPSPVDQQLQQRLMEMLQTNTGDVNTGSQEYQSQLGSFRRGQGRAMEQAKNAAAERANTGGTLNSGGFDAAQTGIDIAAIQGEGDFTAQLAGQQLSRQREDLQQALQLAQQRGMAQEANQLQERLSQVDTNLRQQGLNLQGELGRGGLDMQGRGLDLQRQLGLGDLDLRRLLGQGQLDLGRGDLDLRRLLGLGQLDLGRQQLGLGQDRLGFDYAQLGQQGDQAALQAILQGL